ncbi:hypothetical protein [Mangrovibacterium marinum]|uniref:Uncharacterized protein n=1 Tax=Mangrovibacterium marinum TaxID=1639118 RepID=A0A2T5BYT8_9BACT|nr:hypothetical protein [Mangrovibacterium marinum]PTN07392.1 hypothetical protein C8N47_11845 [Mangrovibacterium marinum]
MKKQLLTLGLFLLAAVAGINESNAQKAVTWSKPTKLDCTTDELHPVAGKEYTYEAEANDPTGDGKWRFWATKDPNFIDNGQFNVDKALEEGADGLLKASDDYNVEIDPDDVNVNTDGTVQISWTSGLLNSIINTDDSLYVVAYYENAAGCTDQANVWLIDPKNYFTVDIIAMDPAKPADSQDDYGVTPTTCVDYIESMKMRSGKLVYDYGDNYLYFEFIAANFTDYWIPEFRLDGLNAVQGVEYEYTYALPGSWNATTVWSPLVSGTTHIEPDGTYTDAGVSVFVRVKVDHNTYETLNAQTLTMYLDGKLADGMYDTVNETCTDPKAADEGDSASTTITPRPENTDTAMPDPHFILKTSVNN